MTNTQLVKNIKSQQKSLFSRLEVERRREVTKLAKALATTLDAEYAGEVHRRRG